MQKQLKYLHQDEELRTIEIVNNGSFEMSGGTIHTMSNVIDNPPKVISQTLGYDPALKQLGVNIKSENKFKLEPLKQISIELV